jgi:hypothetical protein
MRPDIFDNVHKGIRKALFDLCSALGRAGDDPVAGADARRRAHEVVHFLRHHGENEELLLVPLLADRAPDAHARMVNDHAHVQEAIDRFATAIDHEGTFVLYHEACTLTAAYLEHMRVEELELLPRIAAVLTPAECGAFSRESVARTAPADQRMMLGYMLSAMSRADADALIGRIPPAVADALRPLVA